MDANDELLKRIHPLGEQKCKFILRLLENSLLDFDMLAAIVAEICDVDKNEMLMSKNKGGDLMISCGIFLKAYKYICNADAEHISKKFSQKGIEITGGALFRRINTTEGIINSSIVWMDKWKIVKSVINAYKNNSNRGKYKIEINVPVELYDDVKIEVKKKL